jgi:hypothetical protein
MADDGVRLWIDGDLVLDEWHDSTQETYTVDVHLSAGEHALHLEFYENLGGARIYLDWAWSEPPTATPAPLPTDTPPADVWWGEYFDNVYLDGLPVLTREDPELGFNWGTGSPGEGVPVDDFSARWTRQVWAPSGTYRFYLEADDGARFWVDGELIIDAWPANIGEIYSVEIYLPEGNHLLKVEYFEVTVDARILVWGETVQ